QLADARRPLDLGHLETLLPAAERSAPIVTIQDGASHSLAFLGSVYGVPVVPLGVDQFGQSGSREALYRTAGIDTAQVVNAAMLALGGASAKSLRRAANDRYRRGEAGDGGGGPRRRDGGGRSNRPWRAPPPGTRPPTSRAVCPWAPTSAGSSTWSIRHVHGP